MIRVYYRSRCSSSWQALSWFRAHNIPVHTYEVNKLTKEELLRLLYLSNKGIAEVVKNPCRTNEKVSKAIKYLLDLSSFNEAIKFIITHKEVLQTPIILEEHNYLIGYNESEIRSFLPREYRRQL